MNHVALPEEKKLTVIVRVEPGCLGPEGDAHIDAFCKMAAPEISQIDRHFANWKVIPRSDKTLPEIEYQINDKVLSSEKADRYLGLFSRELYQFEDDLNSYLVTIIEHFMEDKF